MSDERVSEIFVAVADPTRGRLLHFLLEEEHCVTQCTQEVELAQSAVSRHLARLVRAGLIARRPAGRRAYHRVSNPAAVRALLDHTPARSDLARPRRRRASRCGNGGAAIKHLPADEPRLCPATSRLRSWFPREP